MLPVVVYHRGMRGSCPQPPAGFTFSGPGAVSDFIRTSDPSVTSVLCFWGSFRLVISCCVVTGSFLAS